MLWIALVSNLQRNSPEFWNLFWRIPLNKLYQLTDLALPHKMLTAFKHWYADGHHLIQFWKLKNYPKYFDRLDLGMQCITSSIAMLSGNIVVWKYFENVMKIFWLFWCGRNIWECHWPVPNFKPCYARNLDGDQLCDHVVHTNIWWWLHYTIVWSYRARTFEDDHNICTIVMVNPPCMIPVAMMWHVPTSWACDCSSSTSPSCYLWLVKWKIQFFSGSAFRGSTPSIHLKSNRVRLVSI